MFKQMVKNIVGQRGYSRMVESYHHLRDRALGLRLKTRSRLAEAWFLVDPRIRVTIPARARMLGKFRNISRSIKCAHQPYEILTFVSHILRVGPNSNGVFVEAGCFKGGSAAKFSLACALVGKRLVLFDSFAGLPDNTENSGRDIYGGTIALFVEGGYCGAMEEVRSNISRYGDLSVCEFKKGWFDDTMPSFGEPVIGAYIDVDLATSTRTCLKYLFPLLVMDGIVVSQDGLIPRVLEVLDDEDFWAREVGVPRPRMRGFGSSSVVTMLKRGPG